MRTGSVDPAENERKFYFEALKSNECICGRGKKPRHSFCYRCYSSLPMDMRQALWQRIGDGYEEAFEEAVKHIED